MRARGGRSRLDFFRFVSVRSRSLVLPKTPTPFLRPRKTLLPSPKRGGRTKHQISPPPNGRGDIKSSFFVPNRREGGIGNSDEGGDKLFAPRRDKEKRGNTKNAPAVHTSGRAEGRQTARPESKSIPPPNEKGRQSPAPRKTTKKQLLRAAARRRDLFAKFSCYRGGPFRHFSA